MTDSDLITVLILLLVVVIALLVPTGPGTPLPSPVNQR